MNRRDPRLRNKWWRLTHLYKILDKNGNKITFKPSRVQLYILSKLGSRLRARILKYRQGGITTLFCILYLDDALWTPGFGAAIIAHDRETLDKIFEIVDYAFENLPDEIKPETERNTIRMLQFKRDCYGRPLDSEIYVAMKLRGGTVQAMHVSERAYIEGDKSRELEAGSKQAVPIGGRITEETTANGFNEYYDAFMEDYNDPSDSDLEYMALFVAWHEDPQYTLPGQIDEYSPLQIQLKKQVQDEYGYELTDGQLMWYEWKMKDLIKVARESDDKVGLSGRQLMKQEYPSTLLEAFQSGLGNVFDAEIMAQYSAAPVLETIKSQDLPVETDEERIRGEEVRIFQQPVPGKFYALGCDPSDGDGDPAGIAVWDEDYNKCAEWSGKLRPDKLAKLVKSMALKYNDAFCGVENNMLSTILFLSQIYENYFFTVKIDQKRQTRTKKMGWKTTGQSRDVMIDDFIMHFEEETLKSLSAKTLAEMQTFVVKEGGKREHASGKHDDMLISDMIAIQMIKYKGKSRSKKRAFVAKPGTL